MMKRNATWAMTYWAFRGRQLDLWLFCLKQVKHVASQIQIVSKHVKPCQIKIMSNVKNQASHAESKFKTFHKPVRWSVDVMIEEPEDGQEMF